MNEDGPSWAFSSADTIADILKYHTLLWLTIYRSIVLFELLYNSSVEIPAELLPLLRKSSRVAALTGAGVSQESGLRTFRDAQTGLWAQYKPEDLASPEAFRRDPKLVWDWYAWRREAIKGVRPNPGHYALVEMSERFPAFTLITQNVDGLHRFAGSPQVIELHGNIQRVRCAECYTFAEEWNDDGLEIPRCSACGGMLRPHVVWFGESLPRSELEAAVEAARRCEIFFSIGTSGVVQPAASLAHAAHNRGAVVVEINAERTPLTPKADFFLQGRSGEILPALVKAVWH
jgi:NAD-dependent deacetylase